MSQLQFVGLGGMGSVTQNMFLYEYGEELLLVDCGIGFPDQYMPGVDILIPDISYVQKRIDMGKRLVGMILTHGHDDHIGALPYLLPHLPAFPLYGSALTVGFARERLAETELQPDFRVVESRQQFSISGQFRAQGFHMTHSVPDTMHYVITTPGGVVYHGSDFKLDQAPVDGWLSDLEGVGQWQGQVKLMLIDCLRVETPDWVPSESQVGPTIDRLMSQTQGKFVVTLMSSHIHRIQQVITAAQTHRRKVAFIGRSVEQNTRVARDLGLLQVASEMVIDKHDTEAVPDNQLCLIVAGSQGQRARV